MIRSLSKVIGRRLYKTEAAINVTSCSELGRRLEQDALESGATTEREKLCDQHSSKAVSSRDWEEVHLAQLRVGGR